MEIWNLCLLFFTRHNSQNGIGTHAVDLVSFTVEIKWAYSPLGFYTSSPNICLLYIIFTPFTNCTWKVKLKKSIGPIGPWSLIRKKKNGISIGSLEACLFVEIEAEIRHEKNALCVHY